LLGPALQVGGIQSVTLGDEEAKRRGVQKSILERAAPPTFDVAVEMEERGRYAGRPGREAEGGSAWPTHRLLAKSFMAGCM
jgi:hypothetical protein